MNVAEKYRSNREILPFLDCFDWLNISIYQLDGCKPSLMPVMSARANCFKNLASIRGNGSYDENNGHDIYVCPALCPE